jgi:general stress protein 26
MGDAKSRAAAVGRLAEMIKDIPVAMLTTTGMGRLRSRPMVTQREPFDGTLWFVTERGTGKTDDVRERQAVHVTFVAPDEQRFVWASGTASIVDDRARLTALWHDGYLPWIAGGLGNPDLTLIGVRVEEAEYWDAAQGRMARLDAFVQHTGGVRDLEPGVGI